jgi:WD40 repeat protein
MIAADGFKHVEVWDVATGKVVHRLEAPEIQSLSFGPDDSLAVAGGGQAVLWDVAKESKLRSAVGSYMSLSPTGTWLVAKQEPKGIAVQELESGRAVATFPPVSSNATWAITGDGKALGRFSVLGSASM